MSLLATKGDEHDTVDTALSELKAPYTPIGDSAPNAEPSVHRASALQGQVVCAILADLFVSPKKGIVIGLLLGKHMALAD